MVNAPSADGLATRLGEIGTVRRRFFVGLALIETAKE